MDKINSNEKQTLKNTFLSVKYISKLVTKNGKSYLFLKIISTVFDTIAPLPNIVIPGLIINELISAQRLNIIFLYVGILILFPIFLHINSSFTNMILQKRIFELNVQIKTSFYEHLLCMDYKTLEMPEIQDLKGRAENALENSLMVIDSLFNLISAVLKMCVVSSIIISLNSFVILLIIIIVFINSKITEWVNQRQFETNKKDGPFIRGAFAASTMICSLYFGKENRLFNTKSLLIKLFRDHQQKSFELRKSNLKDSILARIVSTTTVSVQNLVLYIFLIMSVIHKGMAVGNLTIYMSAVNNFSISLNAIVSSYLNLSKASLGIQELIRFMDIPHMHHDGGLIVPQVSDSLTITFRDVSFKYPGSEIYALKNINITIHGGERLCIVGANGSGKSTFIKLLTRLYDPTDGEIFINGININKYNYDSYQKLFSPVFQDYCHYYLTIAENIILTDNKNSILLEKVAIDSGIKQLVNKLPKGFDTQIFKMIEDDGVEPSGGEGQKLAIARALYHDRPIYLLDEPTSSLDPTAEHEIYKQFNNMIKGKCAILITHRLSAVQLADKIAVFENGCVEEYGTHKELYAKGGIYTQMFDKQAHFYRDENI